MNIPNGIAGILINGLMLACLAIGPIEANAQTIDIGPADTLLCDASSVTLTAVTTGVGTDPTFTNLNLNQDDVHSQVVDIGFDFEFFGNTYNQCVVSSNSYITFNLGTAGTGSPWAINAPSPSPGVPDNAIMFPWQDVNPAAGSAGTDAVDCGDGTFIVDFVETAMFSCENLFFSMQVVMYEGTNIIDTYITNKPLCTTWNGGAAIHGLENIDGTQAVIVPGRNFPQQWTATNDAVRFTPDGNGSYTIDQTIPFNPIPVGNEVLEWTDASGNVLGNSTSITVSPTEPTWYFCSYRSACATASVTDSILVIPGYVNPVFEDVTVCPGASVTLDAGEQMEGSTFLWTPGGADGQVFTVDNMETTTTFTLEVTNECGTAPFSVEVTVNEVVLSGDTAVCETAEASVSVSNSLNGGQWSATGPGEATFTPDASNDSPTVSFSAPGNYEVIYTDNFCQRGNVLGLHVIPVPVVSIASDTDAVCLQGELLLTFTSNTDVIGSFEWSPFGSSEDTLLIAGADSMAFNLLTDSFLVELEVENHCGVGNAEFTYSVVDCELTIPNVFNPNANYLDNTFFNVASLDLHPGNNMKIFDRWGRKCLDQDNYHLNPWTGEKAADGVYYYILTREGYEPITGYVHKIGGNSN